MDVSLVNTERRRERERGEKQLKENYTRHSPRHARPTTWSLKSIQVDLSSERATEIAPQFQIVILSAVGFKCNIKIPIFLQQ